MRLFLGVSAVVLGLLSSACRGDAPSTTSETTNPVVLDVQATPRGGALIREVHRNFRGKDQRLPFLDHAGVEGFRREGDRFVAMPIAPRGKTPFARVTLPELANDSASISAGSLAISIKPQVAPAAVEWAQHFAIHPEVSPGVTLFRRVDQDGLDDVYEVTLPSDALRFAYDLSLGNTAGLRLVDGTLELLDDRGTPEVRVPAPELVDSKGNRRVGAIEIAGCAVDRDPRGPWGRPVVKPGADHCVVTAVIDGRALSYPVLVDPAWVGTANTKATHAYSKMIKLAAGPDAGKILLVGGTGSAATSTELYDIATAKWAVSSPLPEMLGEGVNAVGTSTGSVIVTGGFPASTSAPAKSNTYVRSPSGTWTAGASMSGGRAWHTMIATTIDSKEAILVAGGMVSRSMSSKPLKSAEYYDVAGDSWTSVSGMTAERSHAGAAVLSDGRVMVAGGHGWVGSFGGQIGSVEIFTPATKAWSSGGSLATERSDGVLVAIPGAAPTAVIAGGWNDLDYTLSSLEYWNGTAWTTLPSKMTEPRMFHVGSRLTDGRILFAAGNVANDDPSFAMTATSSADLLELGATPMTTAKIVSSGGMITARIAPSWVSLGSSVLVAGGLTSDFDGSETTSAELFDATIGAPCSSGTCPTGLSCTEGVCCKSASCPEGQTCAAPGFEGVCTKPKGAACTNNTECGTGFCVTGVCCSTACSGDCQTCDVPGKVGDCTNAAVGTDPKKVCGGDPTCGPFCDSTGDCFQYGPVGAKCGGSLGDAGTGSFCKAFACDEWGECLSATNNCGLTCTTSVTCDETSKSCTAMASGIKAGKCVIEGKCWDYGEVNPKDSCQLCDPPSAKTAWSTAASCMDGGTDTGTIDEDTGTLDDTGALEDTGTAEDTGILADTGTADDAAADTGTAVGADLPEASTCGCRTPGGPPRNGAFALLGLALLIARRRGAIPPRRGAVRAR